MSLAGPVSTTTKTASSVVALGGGIYLPLLWWRVPELTDEVRSLRHQTHAQPQ